MREISDNTCIDFQPRQNESKYVHSPLARPSHPAVWVGAAQPFPPSRHGRRDVATSHQDLY